MASERIGAIVGSFHRLFEGGTVAGLSERQLLDRFLARNDPAAFEAIVARHGPMVLGVCRRWLDDPNDADDAFQATFLVLVRKAHELRQRDLLANWLYGVALRVSKRARQQVQSRRRREAALSAGIDRMDRPEDLGPEIHEELAGLPRDYRLPLVLCYLEGRTHEEAAVELGWPLGTVKGRLARAREMLREKLTRRGLAPASGLVVTALERTPRAVPPALLDATVRAATAATAGKLAMAAAASGTVTLLTQETIRAMWMTKIAAIGATGALVALTTGGAVLAYQYGGTTGRATNTTVQVAAAPGGVAAKALSPTEALISEMRTKRLQAAIALWDSSRRQYLEQKLTLDRLIAASGKLRDAEADDRDPGARQAADDNHIKRISDLISKVIQPRIESGVLPSIDLNEANLALAEAILGRARPPVSVPAAQPIAATTAPASVPATVQPATATPAMASGGMGGGGFGMDEEQVRLNDAKRFHGHGLDREPRTRAVLLKLNDTYSFPFEQDTPLEEVLHYVKTITSDENEMPKGIQIYVDEVRMHEVLNITTASTVKIQLEGVPLRTALRFMLRQLGLVYIVKDGILIVTTPEGVLEEIDGDSEVVKSAG